MDEKTKQIAMLTSQLHKEMSIDNTTTAEMCVLLVTDYRKATWEIECMIDFIEMVGNESEKNIAKVLKTLIEEDLKCASSQLNQKA